MAGKDLPAFGQALTANGSSAGILTVASTSGFRVGSRCNLSSTTVAGVEVIVTEVTDATHVKARLATPQKSNTSTVLYGSDQNWKLNPVSYRLGNDFSAYLTADSARLDAAQQLIYNEPAVA